MSTTDHIENLTDLAADLIREGRAGAARVCLDVVRIVKHYEYLKGKAGESFPQATGVASSMVSADTQIQRTADQGMRNVDHQSGEVTCA